MRWVYKGAIYVHISIHRVRVHGSDAIYLHKSLLQKGMAAGSAVSSDTELDFEFSPEGGETTGGGMGSEQDAMAGVSEQPAPSDLAESIKVLVREQTAHALREINVNSRHGGCTSRGESRVGGDILEPYDPQDKDQNVDRWLAKIDQMGAIHHWSEYERSCYMQAKLREAKRTWF